MRHRLGVVAWLVSACSSADFKSQSSKVDPPEVATTHCDALGEYADDELVLDVRKQKQTELSVEGEFCPLAPAQLRLVFVVDFSLSMYNSNPSDDPGHPRGNDQVHAGSCGRLEAARAIVRRQQQSLRGQKAVAKVAIVPFASKLVDGVPLTDLADFAADQLTVDNFCRGIDGTNYAAGLNAVTAMLRQEPGKKIVYFISDGLPTEGGGGERGNLPQHRSAALTAATALRAQVPDLLMNTVYLGNLYDLGDGGSFDPEKFLVDLTGDEQRVKVVAKAEDLAKEIVTLANPKVELDVETVRAVLTATGAADLPVELARFAPAAGKAQTWEFVTKQFQAFPGDDMQSELTISANDLDGQEFAVTFKIAPRTTPTDAGLRSP